MLLFNLSLLLLAVKCAKNIPDHYRIFSKIMKDYKSEIIPIKNDEKIVVDFSMELYQIIEVDEPGQSIKINAWIQEKWVDNMLGWDPAEFNNISELIIPHDDVWLPDTKLYNSLDNQDSDEHRWFHAKLTTLGNNGTEVKLLYPKLFTSSCMLDLRYFPFDVQTCEFTFGSWSFDNHLIDYSIIENATAIGTSHCIENDGWNLLSTHAEKINKKFDCCVNNYTILEFSIRIQRKPLYYIVNLIFPTGIITFISILGFFTSSSINDLRQEKITLGITTLLSMSILVFMVSDKMPSTSSFVPLIGWFYSSMIIIISLATLFASIVIFIQKQGILGKSPRQDYLKMAKRFAAKINIQMPFIMKQAYWRKAKEEKLKRGRRSSIWKMVQKVHRGSFSSKRNVIVAPRKISQDLYNNKSFKRYSEGNLAKRDLIINHADVDQLSDISQLSEDKPKYSVICLPKPHRNIAQLEWDWLAAVFERMCLVVFVVLFILCSLGINCIGYYHWRIAAIDDVHTLV